MLCFQCNHAVNYLHFSLSFSMYELMNEIFRFARITMARSTNIAKTVKKKKKKANSTPLHCVALLCEQSLISESMHLISALANVVCYLVWEHNITWQCKQMEPKVSVNDTFTYCAFVAAGSLRWVHLCVWVTRFTQLSTTCIFYI